MSAICIDFSARKLYQLSNTHTKYPVGQFVLHCKCRVNRTYILMSVVIQHNIWRSRSIRTATVVVGQNSRRRKNHAKIQKGKKINIIERSPIIETSILQLLISKNSTAETTAFLSFSVTPHKTVSRVQYSFAVLCAIFTFSFVLIC